MAYFWVNQKQTYKQEREGGYLWLQNVTVTVTNTGDGKLW